MDPADNRRSRRQAVTVALLFFGYVGYYLCRSNLSVCQPLIEADLRAHGVSQADARQGLGWIVSFGILGYAAGKFLSGALADSLGGRRIFLAGMAGSVACTVLFAIGGGLPAFTFAWIANRFFQSIGWLGLVKVTSRWFSYANYGKVMGLLSLSYLFGDAAARRFMGALLHADLAWRGVFLVVAALLALAFVVCYALLAESPAQLGLAEPPANPANVYGESGQSPDAPAPRFRDLLLPLLASPGFLLVCLLSVGLTLLRETINHWTPTYFVDELHLTRADAASCSALFPLFGGVSVLLAGFASDRLGRVGRAAIIGGGLALAGFALAALGLARFGSSSAVPIALVAAVGFLLVGPYSFLAGSIAMDFGGKHGSATASGLIDGFGYVVGSLAGAGVARLSLTLGWPGAFLALAAVSWLTAGVAAAFLLQQRRALVAA